MTEGNITSWKVGEGDLFSAGDVLLEIETDKAQMDVEAQDDGKVYKITQHSGAKGVKVGTRIAVMAETEDDIGSLSLPIEEHSPPSTQEGAKPATGGDNDVQSSAFQTKALPSLKGRNTKPANPARDSGSGPLSSKSRKQNYPLYPSIAQILHEKNIPTSEADNIPASGPKGRLLKGDVLAYIGEIPSTYPSDQSARISKLGHLDLSNVKPASKEAVVNPADETHAPTSAAKPINTEVSTPIALSSVLSVQKRIQTTLGITLPLSTFITRATELANEKLPRSTAANPTADELFHDVLGLNYLNSKTSKGRYMPQIAALPVQPLDSGALSRSDIYDVLTNHPSPQPKKRLGMSPARTVIGSHAGDATDILSVSAPQGDEERAKMFLERVKTTLQVEPGKLIL